ncbi:putative baseplate assembly protein [Salinigranum sp. GCM10025319]|uniref:putative baseplate assembly protein n=1 Tax=Salinigranum sp. GCM10025319 TaxID=3252687 RepID=UPI00360B1E61
MGLDVPELDDRTFAELMTDLRKRIPVHSSTWTDHNESDPGITMLEVLAWVAESDIYQLDRVTDRHVRKYLRLLGVRPRRPLPATVSLHTDPPASLAGTELPAGTRLAVDDAGTVRRFETTRSVALTDSEVEAVVSETPAGRVDNTRANGSEGLHFLPFGRGAAEDSAVYVGFDADPFDGGPRLDLHVDFHEADLPEPAAHGDEPSPFEPSVRVVWEHCTDYDRFYDPAAWQRVDEGPADGETDGFEDGTTHLYHGGTVSIPRPDGWTGADRALFDVPEPLYWLRARVATPGHEVPPQVNAFERGVVEAAHRARYRDEPLVRVPEGMSAEAVRRHPGDGEATTTARPGQEFVFPRAPVLDAEITVGGAAWNRVEDFDASGPDDPDYVLDHERGVVQFGDGVRGEVPAPDRAVEATWYDHGGGEAGNVAGDAEWRVDDEALAGVDVSARGPATGGEDAESTDAALARLKGDLRTPYRAVTADDYRYLATHTPGLRFGRAAVHVGDGDASEACARRGVVTVAVVPYSPPHRDRPEPSAGFLDAVACHLQRHRLLTDEVVVEPPTYVGVDVRAEVEVEDGYAADHVVEAVEDELDRFLDPPRRIRRRRLAVRPTGVPLGGVRGGRGRPGRRLRPRRGTDGRRTG